MSCEKQQKIVRIATNEGRFIVTDVLIKAIKDLARNLHYLKL